METTTIATVSRPKAKDISSSLLWTYSTYFSIVSYGYVIKNGVDIFLGGFYFLFLFSLQFEMLLLFVAFCGNISYLLMLLLFEVLWAFVCLGGFQSSSSVVSLRMGGFYGGQVQLFMAHAEQWSVSLAAMVFCSSFLARKLIHR